MVAQYAFKIKQLTAHDSLLGKHFLVGFVLFFVFLRNHSEFCSPFSYRLIGSINFKPDSPVYL